jgi:hypothetical protein
MYPGGVEEALPDLARAAAPRLAIGVTAPVLVNQCSDWVRSGLGMATIDSVLLTHLQPPSVHRSSRVWRRDATVIAASIVADTS